MTMEEQQSILIFKPNEDVMLPLTEAYQNHFEMIKEDQAEFICRVIIQDQSEYGIILPAKIIDNKEISFSLPEQLCIFNPKKTYFLKVEVVLETELVTPVFQQCQIDLNDLIEPEEESDEEDNEQNLDALEEAINEPEDNLLNNNDNDEDLESVLDAIAPIVETKIKKTKVEDIVKQLDEEFVKNALWRKEEKLNRKEVAPILIKESELPLNSESIKIKDKMKNLLRNMLG